MTTRRVLVLASLALVVKDPALALAVPAQQASSQVRDSAGIQIVESRAPQYRSGHFWTISANPTVAIGEAEGDSAYQFHRIFGVTRLHDGGIVVLNSGAAIDASRTGAACYSEIVATAADTG